MYLVFKKKVKKINVCLHVAYISYLDFKALISLLSVFLQFCCI